MRKIIIATLLIMLCSLSPAVADEVLQEFSGDGTYTTKPFTVPDGWEIEWESKGAYLQILINTSDSVPLGFAAEQTGPGSGSSYQADGGTYYLDMNAMGDWKVKVVKKDAKPE